jgi:hypothetical protein
VLEVARKRLRHAGEALLELTLDLRHHR